MVVAQGIIHGMSVLHKLDVQNNIILDSTFHIVKTVNRQFVQIIHLIQINILPSLSYLPVLKRFIIISTGVS